jgi:branched-chain amino acid transport system substrate-binding protein
MQASSFTVELLRTMNRRSALLRLSAVSGAVALPAIAQSKSIVLGQSAAFTGAAAQLGVQLNAGMKLFFDEINAGGGVNGQKVELKTLDDGYEPDRCKANTEQFIKSGVDALIGYVGTPTCVAALPLVNESKTPFFGAFTGAEVLRQPVAKSVFHLRASYYDETEAIVKHLTNLGLTKIAVFYQDDAYGKAGLEGMNRALKTRNLTPVALGTVQRNTVDVAKAVEAIVPTQPHAIVKISAYKSCAAMIRESRKAGFGGTFYNVSFVGTQALANELGKDGAGVVVSQVMPYPYSPSLPITREFLAAVAKAGGDYKANYSSLEGYLAAKVFTEGLKRAGRNLSSDAIVAGLEGIRSADFGGFSVSFGPNDHVASKYVDISMLTGDGRVRV